MQQAQLALNATVVATAPFVEAIFRAEHANILARLPPIDLAAPVEYEPPATKPCARDGHVPSVQPGCAKCQGRASSESLDPYAKAFAALHCRGVQGITWANASANKWATQGCHIEMAKLYCPKLGQSAGRKEFAELDGTALFNMLSWCTLFHIDYVGPQGVGQAAAKARNTTKHEDRLALTAAEYADVFAGFRMLLGRLAQEADAAVVRGAQDALAKLDAWERDHHLQQSREQQRAVAGAAP